MKRTQDAVLFHWAIQKRWPTAVAALQRGESHLIKAGDQMRQRVIGAATNRAGSGEIAQAIRDRQENRGA